MSHPEFVPDRIYNVAKIAAQIYQDEHLTGLEVITMSGEKLLLAMSGQGLLELRDQISATYERRID